MFFMSGDSTKEWASHLWEGSSGWSILKPPADFKMVPCTTRLPLMVAVPKTAEPARTCPCAFCGEPLPTATHPDPQLDNPLFALPVAGSVVLLQPIIW